MSTPPLNHQVSRNWLTITDGRPSVREISVTQGILTIRLQLWRFPNFGIDSDFFRATAARKYRSSACELDLIFTVVII
jgi:hypothetical protein